MYWVNILDDNLVIQHQGININNGIWYYIILQGVSSHTRVKATKTGFQIAWQEVIVFSVPWQPKFIQWIGICQTMERKVMSGKKQE